MASDRVIVRGEPTLDSSAINFVSCGGGLKRASDIAIAVIALVLLWPLFLITWIVVRATSRGPVVFAHERIGLRGRRFPCYKFRSMIVGFDFDGYLRANPEAKAEWKQIQKLRNDPRITSVGNFLRKSSIDELPQLWNVLKGDMSIVGPRPIVSNEIWRYGKDIAFYSAAKPGITGLWQVEARNDCSYEERVAFDVDYVRNWSLGRDISIILRTFVAIFSKKGSY